MPKYFRMKVFNLYGRALKWFLKKSHKIFSNSPMCWHGLTDFSPNHIACMFLFKGTQKVRKYLWVCVSFFKVLIVIILCFCFLRLDKIMVCGNRYLKVNFILVLDTMVTSQFSKLEIYTDLCHFCWLICLIFMQVNTFYSGM